jgi:predicted dehydrogenase
MKQIRCAIVGLGRIGSLLEEDRLREKPATHAGAVFHNPDCTLVAGCDIREDRRRLFEKRWGCKTVYPDVSTMLAENHIDILHIATPPRTHLEIVMTAAGYNVPFVVCEKPLAENSRGASMIAELQTSGMVRILVNHERRYSREYLMAKDHIKKRSFGSLLSISARLYMGRDRRVNDILLDDGTHLIDIIHFLTDTPLDKVSAERIDKKEQESLWILGSTGDVPVLLEIASGRDHVVFELDLSFSSGRIRVGNGLYEEYGSGPSPFYEGMQSLLKNEATRPFPTGYFSNMLSDAVRCFRDKNLEPVSSAVDGYRAVAFIDSIKSEKW